jgi:nitronate monooxygenase
MFLISGPDLVIAAAKAGIIGAFPATNARQIEELQSWFEKIRQMLTPAERTRWGVNLIVHKSYDRFERELDLVLEYQPPIVITALGNPQRPLECVHSYGGVVLADVINIEQARRAIDKGVDGLILVCAGAGGHTGAYNSFAFVEEVRAFWDGLLVLAGGISTGRAIKAAVTLGADLVHMGTRFIAVPESLVCDDYRQMVLRARIQDIITSAAVSGVPANWLRESLERAKINPDMLHKPIKVDFSNAAGDSKVWKDVWGAGHGVGSVMEIEKVSSIVSSLVSEFES